MQSESFGVDKIRPSSMKFTDRPQRGSCVQHGEMMSKDSYLPADTSQPLLEMAMGDLLRSVAAESPDQIFLVDGVADVAARTRMTYAEVLRAAERIASFLGSKFSRDDNLAIWAPNCLEWVLVELGASLAGIPLVMINPALRRDELRFVLDQSRGRGYVPCAQLSRQCDGCDC